MKRVFRTVVKEDAKFEDKGYISGVIVGMCNAICGVDPNKDYAIGVTEGTTAIIYRETTKLRYWLFKHKVERLYPGLCVFDYEG